jgi:hypothetical protein
MPHPSNTTVTEAWLVPVEYWDETMYFDVVAAVGNTLPIGQMMKVYLGSDGGVFDIIELRARGQTYSHDLPIIPPLTLGMPAVIVTSVLEPGTDRRWAVNGLYRRSVHLLNQGDELTSIGDTWNFAAAPAFPLKGCRVELVDVKTIRGGTVPICRLKVERDPAEFIDLYFQDNVPSWRSPDIWVGYPGPPSVPHIYPEGTPTDQGDIVHFPSSGADPIPHFLVVRPHNAGSVNAEDVKGALVHLRSAGRWGRREVGRTRHRYDPADRRQQLGALCVHVERRLVHEFPSVPACRDHRLEDPHRS